MTQRGNRRQQTFFSDDDYLYYLRTMEQLSTQYSVNVSAYCLMPNHVHLLLVPPSRESLISMVSKLHERYTRYLNFKMGWRGYLWQGRFFSVPLSEQHYLNCIAYIELNPLRANLVEDIYSYKWVSRNSDSQSLKLVNVDAYDIIRSATRTGRPRGSKEFLGLVKRITGIDPTPKKPGPKKECGESSMSSSYVVCPSNSSN
ncbi:MAG: transposase [Proteobacteria bacterium]|nr:transposase [Pseudomonadota bacterium]